MKYPYLILLFCSFVIFYTLSLAFIFKNLDEQLTVIQDVKSHFNTIPSVQDPCTLQVITCSDEPQTVIPSTTDLLNFYIENIIQDPTEMRLIKGIAVAESSYGEHMRNFNVFGIQHGYYESLEDAVYDMKRIMEDFYFSYGLYTPEQIITKYVGTYSQQWINNVNSVYLLP